MYDDEELFKLAISATATGNHHAAICHLRELLRQSRKNVGAIYFLAVQYAELGMYDLAIRKFTEALSIDPDMEIARFQLGLLLIDTGSIESAKKQLSMIIDSPNYALRLFSEGLIALADDERSLAKQKIALGLLQENQNGALRDLMQQVLAHIEGNPNNDMEILSKPPYLNAYQKNMPNDAI